MRSQSSCEFSTACAEDTKCSPAGHPTSGELAEIEALVAYIDGLLSTSEVRVLPPDRDHRTRRLKRSQMARGDLIREGGNGKDQVRCPDLCP